ncbi:type I glyceraldehyde-3-phosphate dehydrogenase [Parasedimentitalea huanghaiensis]|uniref:Glyceraldehyde-3-phosphate dehydrogenase n=1 Tax=Parasedimentitalea huanghaiensis TaxID=2682100 RepID=A0A6L6WJU0_9RHOB|nr:glyceraldehyde 3-phosphate dehydrogenase NAD-binding domain-containing protein [Zongyanglinia huanghaiensis]MVO16002.1 glyceraldehyde-3-phosphate dehydrogenase [Zongyanglinia huanghaiensis]
MKIAINGFGRIGRAILRQILTSPRGAGIEVALINDIATQEMCAYLFQYDSTFGPFPAPVEVGDSTLNVLGHSIPMSHHADLTQADLSGVDVVLECTGIARTSDVAERGLAAGAGKVLISGPSPAAEQTVVLGANDEALRGARIVSNASCTTNGLAPLANLIDQIAGIDTAHMTTIHCYTNSQPMVDAPRGDFARSRGGAQSMVPTTSSATHLIDQVLPHLAGRISGAAVRVPSASVSAVDLVAQLSRPFSQDSFVAALKEGVANSPVLGWTEQPLVSSDLRARPESLVIAAPETRMVGDRQVRVFGWYDNEWGFSARMLDMARRMAAE